MKKFIKLSSIIMASSILFCLSGCGNSESDYKSAISEHMRIQHDVSIDSYQRFNIYDNGVAHAYVNVTTGLEVGESGGMSAKLTVDEYCNITSCSFCDTLGANAGKGDETISENSALETSTKYQNFILRKTEQLTGFVISVEMGNYEEREVIENGRTYIDIFAFINIEEMAGTPIYSNSVFKLYAIINPDDEEDLFIAITGNSTGEIYRYDHTSIPH